MTDYKEFNKEHLDVLQELGNIGIGNAASALADLINDKIEITIPQLGIVSFEDAFKQIGDIEDSVIGVQIALSGDITGVILFLFNEESALTLTNQIMSLNFGPDSVGQAFDELTQSAVQEIGNILTGNFLKALTQMTNLNTVASPPALAYDMLGAIVTSSLIASQQIEEKVFMFNTQLLQQEKAIEGYFLLLPSPGSLEKIISAVGI